MSNLGGLSEGKRQLLANVAMSVFLYGALIWDDAINARQYRRTEMVLVQWKAVLRCVSAYRTVSTEAVKSAKALRVRCEERQVTLRIWKERLSESSKREWIRLLTRNLDAWLERAHGQMNFYLMQVMSGHRAFNAYLFRMKLVESPECSNCDRKGRDDDAWHPCSSVRHFDCTGRRR